MQTKPPPLLQVNTNIVVSGLFVLLSLIGFIGSVCYINPFSAIASFILMCVCVNLNKKATDVYEMYRDYYDKG
mgnify:CR=1 FL=1